MKIRNGFVSNSSSSSFIIAINESNPCPHCGRKDMDIIDAVEQSSDCDTEVMADYDEVLQELNDQICDAQSSIDDISHLPDDEVVHHRYGSYKIGDERRYRISELQELKRINEQVKQAVQDGKRVAQISISYHNKLLNDMLRQQEKNGTIQIISTDEQ